MEATHIVKLRNPVSSHSDSAHGLSRQQSAPDTSASQNAPSPATNKRRATLFGRYPATGWTCVFGLLVAAIAMLPHLQAFAAHTFNIQILEMAQAKGSSKLETNCNWYTVVPGDTLSGISAQYEVSVDTLATVNQISDPNLIFAGQVLCIPTNEYVGQPAVVQGEPAFVQFVLPYARRAHADTGWPVSMILAQWGLEQGWQTPRFTGYNWGNCGAYDGEPTVPGTSAPGSPPAFAYAPGPEDGLRIYLHVAHLPYYTAIAPAAQNGPDAAARALGESPWDAGHYTDHGDPGSSLIAIMQDFNLYQYD